MRRASRFIGSVYVAIFLIALLLLFVAWGTVLESKADSHAFAAAACYQNPFFIALLWGIFFNILLAAINRYPFKKKHIPFLLAHLGLLMILGGALFKSHFGLQGTFLLMEGGGTSHAFVPGTYALHLEKKEGNTLIPFSIPLKKRQTGPLHAPFDLTLLDWTPHAIEKLEGWVKEEGLHILGFPPLPFYTFAEGKKPLISAHLPIVKGSRENWDIYALEGNFIEPIAMACYQHSVVERKVPALLCIKSENEEHLIVLHPKQAPSIETFSLEHPKEFLAFDKGYQGYGFTAQQSPLEIMTTIVPKSVPDTLPLKREEATPRIRLLSDNKIVSYTYDPFGKNLYWPLKPGVWIAHFGAQKALLPLFIRLQKARKINYPGGDRPFSYECDILIYEDGKEKEVTIAMNKVYQGKKGYRFYLSNLFVPEGANRAKKAQFIVNYDPVRYSLTYPGCFLLALGIGLLFWAAPYKSKENSCK